jgi:hypothetical protein
MKLLSVLCLGSFLGASGQSLLSNLPEAPESAEKALRFLFNNVDRILVGIEFSTRALDATTTHINMSNRCNCFKEVGTVFGLGNMGPVASRPVADHSFFIGVAVGTSVLSSWMWNSSEHHRHGRAMRMVARLILVGDSSLESLTDIRNLRLMNKAPPQP